MIYSQRSLLTCVWLSCADAAGSCTERARMQRGNPSAGAHAQLPFTALLMALCLERTTVSTDHGGARAFLICKRATGGMDDPDQDTREKKQSALYALLVLPRESKGRNGSPIYLTSYCLTSEKRVTSIRRSAHQTAGLQVADITPLVARPNAVLVDKEDAHAGVVVLGLLHEVVVQELADLQCGRQGGRGTAMFCIR